MTFVPMITGQLELYSVSGTTSTGTGKTKSERKGTEIVVSIKPRYFREDPSATEMCKSVLRSCRDGLSDRLL
jgi:hypothetical protein